MNELVRVNVTEDGRRVVGGRELREFLEIKTPYTQWFTRMCEYGFVENRDFVCLTKTLVTNNPKNPMTTIIDHAVSLNMAKEISMIQRNEKGKQARRYFIECERQLLEQKQLLPQTYREALLELVATLEPKLFLKSVDK